MLRLLNLGPTARAGADRLVPTGALVTLDGSASWDGDDDPLQYEWREPSGTVIATTPIVSFSLGRGTWTFTLRVRDVLGAESTDTIKITVDGFPVANAGPDQTWKPVPPCVSTDRPPTIRTATRSRSRGATLRDRCSERPPWSTSACPSVPTR
jgi:hypothetical protein